MISLRPYQTQAVESVFEEWKEKRSTLIVEPTGCGKTTIFTEVIRRAQPRRAIVLTHREELLTQAARRIESQANVTCDIEMGNLRASTSLFSRSECIVATVQSLYSGGEGEERMLKFRPQDFGLLICDEAHHYTSPSFRKVIDYFRQNPELKVLGVTATPDRTDEQALGQIFESVAHDYEILDAIHDGWLVPVQQQMVEVQSLDFSKVRTTAGDLNGADLAALMEAEETLQGVASSSIEIIGGRRTLAFTSSVKHAEMLCDIFNRHRPDMAAWVCGATHKQLRRETLEKFSSGQTQVLVNCGVLTEGFDCPQVEVIIQARPTKSRCLYAQIIGRSLRPLPGIVDGLETPEERTTAIKQSQKPSALIVDFVGNAGRHKLMTTADILGGNVSDEAIENAVKRATKEGKSVNMVDMLEAEEERLRRFEELRRKEAARKAHLVGKATFSTRTVDAFDAYQMEPTRSRGWDDGKRLSEKQNGVLLKAGINPEGLPYAQAKQLLNEQFRRWNQKLCTYKQAKLLQKHGYQTKDLPMTEASRLIDALAKNGWRKPQEMAA